MGRFSAFKRTMIFALLCSAALAGCLMLVSRADARPDTKKAIWGPVLQNGVSQFPIYADLGAGIYQYSLGWGNIAESRPANPTDPNDPAYKWPADADFMISEAARYGIQVSIMLTQSPEWATGCDNTFCEPRKEDFADFATAAARRFPTVKLWMIWGEPTIAGHFLPFDPKTVPRRYASLLDASYVALKSVSPANRVIGGNTITRGQIKPLTFMKGLRLPNGQPPRMDMWGHNPFSPRKPNLKSDPKKAGTADTSDLDTMLGWLDKHLRQGKRNRKLKIFVSEWTILTDFSDPLFNFWADRKTTANYLSKALKITRRMKRVHSLGWYQLYDQPPNGMRTQSNWGLLTYDGLRKPAYYAFRAG